MRFYISKRLPFGLRAGVLSDPVYFGSDRGSRPTGSIAGLGEGVSGVYVITGAHNMCKIGISTDPELRLAALQTGSHIKLKLHYVLALKTIDPRVIEEMAHRILDKYRCAGEWFDVTPIMAEDAVNAAAKHYGIGVAHLDQGLSVLPEKMSGISKFLMAGIVIAVMIYWLTQTFPSHTFGN